MVEGREVKVWWREGGEVVMVEGGEGVKEGGR